MIGKITPGGVTTEYPVTAGGDQFGITDKALWFAQAVANDIGRITTPALSAPSGA